ncbi:MAG: hypothetical protein E7774_08515 [Bradyrhizobium sp.]|nr:MAG: hypothetical protein E7774_08515 [Bradyrhizobium sp.]
MSDLSPRIIAHALGGEVSGGEVRAPGPGHGSRDRSLSVKISASAPDGFVVFSFANDDWQSCRDYVRARLGLARKVFEPRREITRATASERTQAASRGDGAQGERDKAQWFWRKRRPIIEGTPAWRYLRDVRGYAGAIPATLGFLPPNGNHGPALIAAFARCSEPEPSLLEVSDANVKAVQIIKLRPDGSDKAATDPNKIVIGRGAIGVPIEISLMNNLLGLAVVEGVEDALSLLEANGYGVWASAGATRMAALAKTIPQWTDCVSICAHVGDPKRAGERASEELMDGLQKRGIRAEIIPFPKDHAR